MDIRNKGLHMVEDGNDNTFRVRGGSGVGCPCTRKHTLCCLVAAYIWRFLLGST